MSAMRDRSSLVLLGRVGDAGRARLIAARLESEGVDVHLRSEASGPYPFTVGQMAVAELWVVDNQLEEARRIMLEAEVDDVLGEAERQIPAWTWPSRLFALAVATIFLGLFLRRLIIILGG